MQHSIVWKAMYAVNKLNFLYTIWGFQLLLQCAAFVGAVCTTPRSAALHCGVVLPIPQPFGGISFFIFYRSGDWCKA